MSAVYGTQHGAFSTRCLLTLVLVSSHKDETLRSNTKHTQVRLMAVWLPL